MSQISPKRHSTKMYAVLESSCDNCRDLWESQIPVICGQFCEKWKETYGMERLIVWDSDSMTLVFWCCVGINGWWDRRTPLINAL